MGRRGRRGPSRSAGSAALSSAPGSSGAATRILPPLLASIALSILFVAQRWFWVRDEAYFVLFDDAMISMRYARNLVEGHGLVWNPWQAPARMPPRIGRFWPGHTKWDTSTASAGSGPT
jgi:hypothetical protein